MWSLLVLIALVILFYCEEDWRGARAWTKAQAEMVAQGISLDPKTYIPPPVPEAENFGALPIFRLEPAPSKTRFLTLWRWIELLRRCLSTSPIQKTRLQKPGCFPTWALGSEVKSSISARCKSDWPSFAAKPLPPSRYPPMPAHQKCLACFVLLCPIFERLMPLIRHAVLNTITPTQSPQLPS